MKRGFLYTLMALLLVTVLVDLAVLDTDSRMRAAMRASAYNRISSAWSDASGEVAPLIGVSISSSENNLSIRDSLPASENHTALLEAYSFFVDNYFSTPGVNVTMRNASGGIFPFWQAAPPLQIVPYGINYTYPASGTGGAWGKRELKIGVASSNFSEVKGLAMRINVTTGWVTTDFAGSCASWSPYAGCGFGTARCLAFDVIIDDLNGTRKAGTCSNFDADLQSNLTLSVSNWTSSGWVKLSLGRVTQGNLAGISFSGVSLDVETNFTMASADHAIVLPNHLYVNDSFFNASRTASIALG